MGAAVKVAPPTLPARVLNPGRQGMAVILS